MMWSAKSIHPDSFVVPADLKINAEITSIQQLASEKYTTTWMLDEYGKVHVVNYHEGQRKHPADLSFLHTILQESSYTFSQIIATDTGSIFALDKENNIHRFQLDDQSLYWQVAQSTTVDSASPPDLQQSIQRTDLTYTDLLTFKANAADTFASVNTLWKRLKAGETSVSIPGTGNSVDITNNVLTGPAPFPNNAAKNLATPLINYFKAHLINIDPSKPWSAHSFPRPIKTLSYFLQHKLTGRKGLTNLYLATKTLYANLANKSHSTINVNINTLLNQLSSDDRPNNHRLNDTHVAEAKDFLSSLYQHSEQQLTRLEKKLGILTEAGTLNSNYKANKTAHITAALNPNVTSENLTHLWNNYWSTFTDQDSDNSITDVKRIAQLLVEKETFLKTPSAKNNFMRRDQYDNVGLINADISLDLSTHQQVIALLRDVQLRKISTADFSSRLESIKDNYTNNPIKKVADLGFSNFDRLEAAYDSFKYFSKVLNKSHHAVNVAAGTSLETTDSKNTIEKLHKIVKELSSGESVSLTRDYGFGLGTRLVVKGVPDYLDPIPVMSSGMDRSYQLIISRSDDGYNVIVGRDGTIPLFLGYTRGMSHELNGEANDSTATEGSDWQTKLKLPGVYGKFLFRAKFNNETNLELTEKEFDQFYKLLTQKDANPLDLMTFAQKVEFKRGRKLAFDADIGAGTDLNVDNKSLLPVDSISQMLRFRGRARIMVNVLSATKEWSSTTTSTGENSHSHSNNSLNIANKAKAEVGIGTVIRGGPEPDPVGGGGMSKTDIALEAGIDNKSGKKYDWSFVKADSVEIEKWSVTATNLLTHHRNQLNNSLKNHLILLENIYSNDEVSILIPKLQQNINQLLESDNISTEFRSQLNELNLLIQQQSLAEKGYSQLSKVSYSKTYSNLNRIDQPTFWRQLFPNSESHVHNLQQLINDDAKFRVIVAALQASEGTELKIKLSLTDEARLKLQDLLLNNESHMSENFGDELTTIISQESNYRIQSMEVAATTQNETSFDVFVGAKYKSTASFGIKRQLGKVAFNYQNGVLTGYQLSGDLNELTATNLTHAVNKLNNKRHIADPKLLSDLTESLQQTRTDPDTPSHQKLMKSARTIGKFNMGLQLAQLPGAIYQIQDAINRGDVKNAVKGGLATGFDTLDLSLDLIANSRHMQHLSQRLASSAGKAGAFTSFVGAGLSAWSAVDSFNEASRTTGQARVDAIVNGSLAIASSLVAIATGLASLVTAAAGPIGAAIGLAIGIAQGIYNAVRVTQQLREAGISEGDLWRAGAAIFFGFPVPEDIQNKAVRNQVFKAYQDQMAKQFEQLSRSGIDKLVYSEGHVETSYGKYMTQADRHDYHNLSNAEYQEYLRHVPNNNEGLVFGHDPKPALVMEKPNLTSNGTTLFMLGKGYDAANGDLNRKNIFQINGWGRKHLTGGNQSDLFEFNGWRHGEGNADNGQSTFYGGDGEDTISFRSYFSHRPSRYNHGVTIDLVKGSGDTPATYNFLVSQIEHVLGSEKNDQIKGNNLNNALTGFEGDDKLEGMAGDDTLAGGKGTNQLNGGQGHDSYLIQADDFDSIEHSNLINNYDNHYQKNWQELYDDYYASGMRLREQGISYLDDESLDTLATQSRWHADRQIKNPNTSLPANPAEDFLITNIYNLELVQHDKNLVIQAQQQSLRWQQLWQQLQRVKNQNSEQTDYFTEWQKLLTQRFPAMNINQQLLTSIEQAIEHPAVIAGLHPQLSPIKAQLEDTTQYQAIATVENYYEGRAWQHLSLMDLQGNHYYFSALETNEPLTINQVQLSDHQELKGYSVNLRTGLVEQQLNSGTQVTSLLSNHISLVQGSKADDEIRGNEQDNWLMGGSGFDRIFGGAGDDILNAGEQGGRLIGGNGRDLYQVDGNQQQVFINNKADDGLTDILELTSGSQALSTSLTNKHLKLQYQNTQVLLREWRLNGENQHLVVKVTDSKQASFGSHYFQINNEGTLQLNYLQLHTANVDYAVDLTTQQLKWNDNHQTFSSSMGTLADQIFITLGDGNDRVIVDQQLTHLTLGNGRDTVELNDQSTVVVIDNLATDHQQDTVAWHSLQQDQLEGYLVNDDLVLLNQSKQQTLIVKDWADNEDNQHITITTQNGNTLGSRQLEQLVQSMSHMSDESSAHDTLTNIYNRLNTDNILTAHT
ncbi:AvrE-family type 3 secretion system effector [Zooshikella sp. RANM57]|uniref:AvrE-family type 3 secretion system effector n=1 Tax=Zooshikella sp. RANM57 TaxID=3425863 RepID=UPI003D6E2014